MTATFWNMRRRQVATKANQPKQAEPEQLEIVPETDGAFTEIADGPSKALAKKKSTKSKVKSNE